MLFIHNQTTLPESTNPIFLKPNTLTYIGLSQSFSQFTPDPYSSCEDLSSFNFDRTYYNATISSSLAYTQSTCLDVCIAQQIIAQCGCSYLDIVPIQQATSCSNANDFVCVNNFYLNLSQKNQYMICQNFCPLECNDQNYQFSISSSGYPSDNYAQFLNFPNIQFNKNQYLNLTDYKSEVLSVYIYFDDNKYSLVSTSPQYRYWDIFSITGGLVSLFIGFSVLALFQIIDMFFELFMVYWEWRKSKKVSKEEDLEKKRDRDEAKRQVGIYLFLLAKSQVLTIVKKTYKAFNRYFSDIF